MKEFNMTDLRKELEQLPTQQLDAMLREELNKELPDEYAVRLILKVLREREADYPVDSNEQISKALEKYQEKSTPKKLRLGPTLLRVATVLVVIGALVVMQPKEAYAKNFFDRIAAWTDSIFELFSLSDSNRPKTEYEFHTDHPGLQEVYDTVTELGVTVPVVPMWLDKNYELIECEVTGTPVETFLFATFSNGEKEVVYEIDIYAKNVQREYHKNEPDAEEYENDGITHNIIQNNDLWVAVWAIDNIECSIFIDCQEDTLYEILDSIYTTEE